MCLMLVNLDTKVTYLYLAIVEQLKEEKLNANEKLFDGKLQTEHFLFCLSGLLFDFFSPLEVSLSGTN